MIPRIKSLAIVLLCLFAVTATGEERTWTSDDGMFSVSAEFVELKADVVRLKKEDGSVVDVPISRLSNADQRFVQNLGRPAAKLPPEILKFKVAMEEMREVEAKRLEKRIDDMDAQLRAGRSNLKHPVGAEAKRLTAELKNRLRSIKANKPYLPRLSPKDMAVGQIGTLDDDIRLSVTDINQNTADVSIVFDKISFKTKIPNIPGMWHHTTISRPDKIYVEGDFVPQLPLKEKANDVRSKSNQTLHGQLYEVTDVKKRGLAKDFVLTAVKKKPITAWLEQEAEKK